MSSKYQLVLDDILAKIENATYKPGDRIPTENELTALYQASRTTIQKTLNILVNRGLIFRIAGKGTFISEKAASDADKANSAPDSSENVPTIPSTIVSTNDTFAIVLPYQSQITIRYLNAAQKYLEKHNFRLTAHFTDYSPENEILTIDKLVKNDCAGIIFYPNASEGKDGVYRRLNHIKIPMVTIDKEIIGAFFSNVASNNYQGGYSVAEYFIEKGHRQFAFLSYPFTVGNSLLERYRGFTDCLKNHGLALSRENTLIFSSMEDEDIEPCNFIKSYLNRAGTDFPSAIFCTSDGLAAFVYRAAYDLNLKIPEAFSVIGYDNLDLAAMISPALTTIEQPYYEIGKNAAKLLLKAHLSPSDTVTHLHLPTTLIERNSVASLPRG